MGSELTCRDCDAFLADYLEGELTEEVRACFERHLALCPECVDYLASYRDAIRLGRAAHGAGADAIPEELVQAILAARRAAGGGA